MSSSSLQSSIEQFLLYLQQVKQLSPHTISNYRRDLANLLAFCEEQDLQRSDAVEAAHIRQWASQLHRRGLAGSSIQRALSAVRSLYNYLGKESGQQFNPAVGVSAPRMPRKLPKTLDADQVDRFLKFGTDSPLQSRDRAICELFYSSGLRLAELASLDLGDIDRHSGLITVTGKGSKTRTVPVGSVALEALDAWLQLRQEQPVAEDAGQAMFLSSRGQRLSTRSIQSRLRLQGRRAGMHQDVHPHMLRHSFASHVLESSGDLRAVQELLGHANISTTQIYTHLDFQHLAKVYDGAHPRAQRKGRGKRGGNKT